ncbi:N-acetylglucosamine/diacetylchitobiose ABC transporter substrate-binding protein [Streptomyces sp. TRM 70361]|uniref:N-acetylglucosamine/diacetylchitobiose ABC transporter substrate-binding protein n=1 Tax=Streptomyces sp. TRM 70361 TaxID=3116553 RepID=UPI002E7B9A8C|nr:N-acetylglucosamine/diacetylchitobiose ABC transporter substrate-binding protein [Streptomyces sp. TRM 70361]MEE1941147.1 N-acetylglucosamine/diacetylchitobiose ABC transporter substrate-binding protein [Streptomyces sp. TRM 70361]
MGSTDVNRRDLIKRATAAGLVAVPAMGVLSSCATGGDGDNGDKGVAGGKKTDDNPLGVNKDAGLDFVIFDGGFGTQYGKDAAKIYEQNYGKVKLTATQKIRSLLQPRMVGGNPPDLIDNSGAEQMDNPTLAAKDQLTELSPLLDAPSVDDPDTKVRDTLFPGTIEMGQYGDEKVWCLNYAFTVYGQWYSKKLLADNDWEYPKTWDEMLALCAKAKKKGIAGWTYAGQHPYYIPFTLYPFIGKIGGPEALKNIDNLEPNAWKQDAVKSAFEAYYELAAKGYVLKGTPGLDHIQSQTQWTKGKCLFIPNGSWVENEAADTTPKDFEMAVGPVTGLDASDKLPFGTLWAQAGEPFIVPRDARNAAGGMEFLRIMLSKQSAQNFSKLVKSLSCVAGATDGLDMSSGLASASKALEDAGDNVLNPRLFDWYPTLHKQQVGSVLAELMAGRTKPADAMNKCQEYADRTAKDDSVKKYKHA